MSTPRPNIVWIYSDDTDPDWLGYAGKGFYTPNIDRIAREGMILDRWHCTSAVCTPSRYNYLTGHYSGHCPTDDFQGPGDPYCISWNNVIHPEREITVAEVLRRAGYRTGHCGKWHAGPHHDEDMGIVREVASDDPAEVRVDRLLKTRQRRLCEQVRANGFDEAYSVNWSNVDDNHPIRAMQTHNLDWIARGAHQFMDGSQGDQRPFFLSVAPTTIHGPGHIESILGDIRMTAAGIIDGNAGFMPERDSILRRLTAAGVPINHRTVGALWLDDLVGSLLTKLERLGLLENTLVIYTTDHGAFDGKGTCYDGGLRIPLCARLPGRIPAGSRSSALLQNIDFAPTMMEVAGTSAPKDMRIDGRSMWGVLTGREAAVSGRTHLFAEYGHWRAVYDGRWKYIAWRPPVAALERMQSGELTKAYGPRGNTNFDICMERYPSYFAPDQIFDLGTDPTEQVNRWNDPACAAEQERLKALLSTELAAFSRPYPLERQDAYLHSEAFQALAKHAMVNTMANNEWYRMGWY